MEKLCIDEVLNRYVGEFGPAQWIHFSISSMAWAFEALHTLVTIFADRKPDTSCPSICNTTCRWDNPGVSTMSEFNLVCGEAYKVGLAQSLFFVGALIGAGVFGSLSDSFLGRKGGLRVACLASGVLGLATSYSPNYWVYAILRTLTGMVSVGGIGLCSFVLTTEPIGISKRGIAGMSTLYFFSLGTMLLVLMAKLTSYSWRTLYVATSIPSILYSIAVLPIVHESPRWLLVRGERDRAMHVMRSLAKLNGNSVPDNVILSTEMEKEDTESQTEEFASGTIKDVFRQQRLRVRILIMVVIWFACSVVYYGVSLNVGNVGFNLYTSVLLNAAVEIPAFVITAVLLGIIGRRGMLLGCMFLSGICCCVGSVCFGVVSTDSVSIIGLVCGALGIFGMAGAYNLVFIYTSELFPTVVRNAALGLASQAGQVGAIAAPLIVQMAGIHPAVPFGVFAFVGTAGGLLGGRLPETLNQPLFDTLEGILEDSSRKSLLEGSSE